MSGEVPGCLGYSPVEALGVSPRRAIIEEHGDDAAARWLREHDPRLTADGIAREIEAALGAESLTLTEARGAFRKGGGRPSAGLLLLRERVRRALLPLWEDDRRRDLMAQALGCDRTTLWRLLS